MWDQGGGRWLGWILVSTADIEWLNTNETAKRLGITPRTLYRFIDDGKIPAYRFGRVIRLKESEVAEFIESSRIVPGTLEADGITGTAAADSAAGSDSNV
jgi:excisionase family DNA binding protein